MNSECVQAVKITYFTVSSVSYEQISEANLTISPIAKVNLNFNNLENILINASSIVNWKDTDLRFMGCNINLANLLNLKKPKYIIGKYDKDLIWGDDGYAKVFKQEDLEILAGVTKTILGRYTVFGGDKIILVRKIPIIEDKNSIIGIVNFLTEIPDTNLSGIIMSLYGLGITISEPLIENIKKFILKDVLLNGKYSLTNREEECLYYVLRGWTAKEIGKQLGLSNRTIEIYIDSIKEKFQCHNKAALILESVKSGYIHNIPLSIVKKQLNLAQG